MPWRSNYPQMINKRSRSLYLSGRKFAQRFSKQLSWLIIHAFLQNKAIAIAAQQPSEL